MKGPTGDTPDTCKVPPSACSACGGAIKGAAYVFTHESCAERLTKTSPGKPATDPADRPIQGDGPLTSI